ncbi:MAG TPA: MXAN_5187 C-terminal domain-containing protein [Polyangia bacterium]|jgi:hypothetical protein|nr:MXAN_5187 C-terminal domain-containing protein [Polyangia bacterium]
MLRIRIALITALAVAVVTGFALVYVSSTLTKNITHRVEAEIERAETQLLRSARLEAYELTTTVSALAHEEEFTKIFEKLSPLERQQAAFVAVEARRARFEEKAGPEGAKPALIAMVDKAGKVLARDLNPTSLRGEDLAARYPSLGLALKGAANKDIWNFEGSMYRVGAAAIRSASGDVVGALLIGYAESAQDARRDKERLGTEVAYFLDGKISASSFSRGEGQSLESTEEKQIAQQLFEGPKQAEAALGERKAVSFHVTINGVEWVGAAAPLPGNATPSKSGFVVLSSLAAANELVSPVRTGLLGIGLVGVLASLLAASLTARRFLGPLEAIEAGANEVSGGNKDYLFVAPSPDLEGLVNALNLMLARLLGRPDPGDELPPFETTGKTALPRWRGIDLSIEEGSTAGKPAISPELQALSEEPAEEYYARIWKEYLAAREQTGEGTQGLAQASFVSKVKENEITYAKNYKVRAVRFKVKIKNNRATIQPVPLP